MREEDFGETFVSRLRSPTFQPGSWGCVLGGTRVGGGGRPLLGKQGIAGVTWLWFHFLLDHLCDVCPLAADFTSDP